MTASVLASGQRMEGSEINPDRQRGLKLTASHGHREKFGTLVASRVSPDNDCIESSKTNRLRCANSQELIFHSFQIIPGLSNTCPYRTKRVEMNRLLYFQAMSPRSKKDTAITPYPWKGSFLGRFQRLDSLNPRETYDAQRAGFTEHILLGKEAPECSTNEGGAVIGSTSIETKVYLAIDA